MIRRERRTRYITSDGAAWDVHAAAIKHEKFITLRACLDRLMMDDQGPDSIAQALLEHPLLIIALVPGREASQASPGGPANKPATQPSLLGDPS